MKTLINVYNPTTGNSAVTLDYIREENCRRRKQTLSGEGLAKIAQREITVHTTDKTNYKLCCHYPSFELRKMNTKQAIEIYNHDGCQKASIKE
jgi:hypothetical protein